MRLSLSINRLRKDQRGLAAVEFALIAPTLVMVVMGVFELTLRFRASDEATRYVHEVADLVARQNVMATSDLKDLYNASIYMMKPIDTTANLDMDVSAIGFPTDKTKPPTLLWRRWSGGQIAPVLNDATGLGDPNESVILVSINYRYNSPISTLFNGPKLTISRYAYARPRETRMITMDGATGDGTIKSF
jgi:Flp pilus assembly protein TadG